MNIQHPSSQQPITLTTEGFWVLSEDLERIAATARRHAAFLLFQAFTRRFMAADARAERLEDAHTMLVRAAKYEADAAEVHGRIGYPFTV